MLFRSDKQAVATKYSINFDDYFAVERGVLEQLAKDGLITFDETAIRVQPAGRFLIRNLCMVFDKYLRQDQTQRFSKVI